MNLYHYYHVYADGEWGPSVREHIDALQQSGLIDCLTKFNVGIVGDWRARDAVIEYIESRLQDTTWCVCVEADEGWEQVTLDTLGRASLAHTAWGLGQDSYVLYAHSKGAANRSLHQTLWRQVMTQRCVVEWESVIERMQADQYDTAGPYYVEEAQYGAGVPVFAGLHGVSEATRIAFEAAGIPFDPSEHGFDEPQPITTRVHYSGNFWWSCMTWIRQLQRPCPNEKRHDAEFWIGKGRAGALPKALNLESGTAFDMKEFRV